MNLSDIACLAWSTWTVMAALVVVAWAGVMVGYVVLVVGEMKGE